MNLEGCNGRARHSKPLDVLAASAEILNQVTFAKSLQNGLRTRRIQDLLNWRFLDPSKRNRSLFVETTRHDRSIDENSKMS